MVSTKQTGCGKKKGTAAHFEHPFLSLALQCVHPLLTREALESETRPSLTWPEAYFLAVFQKAASLASAIDEARQSRILMVAFPAGAALRRAGMGRADFVHYHLTHYRIAVCSVLDRAMELTNVTLSLGKKSTWLKLDRLEGLVPPSVYRALEALRGAVEAHAQFRNDYVHRGWVEKIPDLEQVAMREFVQRVAHSSLPRVKSALVEDVARYVVATLRPKMLADERRLRLGVDQLFTALRGPHQEKLRSIADHARAELARRRSGGG